MIEVIGELISRLRHTEHFNAVRHHMTHMHAPTIKSTPNICACTIKSISWTLIHIVCNSGKSQCMMCISIAVKLTTTLYMKSLSVM